MSELSVYKGVPSSFGEAQTLAKIFAESGMFDGAKGLAQAMVKVQAGSELGITPYAAMSGIHIISGKPVLGAGLIAAKIKGSGKYDYEVKVSTDTECSIRIVELRGAQRVEIGLEKFTIEMARKAGVKNLEKFPKNMLFARCISNAAKFYCPDIFNGSVYVPEDFETQTVETTATVVESVPAQPAQPVQQAPATTIPAMVSEATAAKVRELCNHSTITESERNNTLAKLNAGVTEETAQKWIRHFENTIASRSQAAAELAPESAPIQSEQPAPAQAPAQQESPELKATGKQIALLRNLCTNPLITEKEKGNCEAKIAAGMGKETADQWANYLSQLIADRTKAGKTIPVQPAEAATDVANFEAAGTATTAAPPDDDIPEWMQ